MSEPVWKFPEQKSGITDYHKNPTESALDSTLEIFVREVLQNANDQSISDDHPVKVTFDFTTLTARDLDDFLETLLWDEEDSPSDLRWHIERAIANEQARDPGLKRFLNAFEEDELTVLTIHDEHTTGLRGSEIDTDQPYASLVKDFGSTNKPGSGSSSGGSKGLGKTVLWAFSGLSTVLFNSNPDIFPDDGGDEAPRLVGRTIVPAHTDPSEETHYTNHGWYGRNDDDLIEEIGRPPSLYGDLGDAGAIADTLSVSRPSDSHGTSIGLVGFRVPGGDLDPDMDELAVAFRHASVKYFWPAMVRGDLEVHVETPNGEHTEATFDDAPGVKPFVECYRELFNVTEEELSGAASIAKRKVDISIPREDPDTVEDDPHDGYETSLDLVVRQLSPADRGNLDDDTSNGDLEINHVARLRGAQMVVDYIDMSPAANRGKDFATVLVGGEAQAEPGTDPSEEQAALEEFLKRSEPTQHDDWVGSNNDFLDEHYIGTITAEINALKGERLQAELTDVVEEDVNAGDEVPGMDDVAPIMDGKSTEDGESSALEWETRPGVWFDDDKWQFFARGGPNIEDHSDWTLTIELVRLDSQEHEGDLIPIDEFDIVDGNAEETRIDGDGVVHVKLNAATDQIAFEGDSRELDGLSRDPATLFEVGEATQTKIKVSAEITEESST